MAGRAVALWGAHIKCGESIFSVHDFAEVPAAVHITMAAINPTAEPSGDGPKRATLKILRRPFNNPYDDDSEEEDSEEESDEESEDEETPKKAGKGGDKMDVDGESKKSKNKKKADEVLAKLANDEDFEDVSDDEDGAEIVEYVLCTLDTERTYQQPLNITIDQDEDVFFSVSGNYDVYLTGNYVTLPAIHGGDDCDDCDSEDEDYDLSPSEDEFDEDESEDELDGLDNPRIEEIESEEEEKVEVKKPSKAEKKAEKKAAAEKGNKRPAEAETPEKPAESKKQQKKLKANDGKSVAVESETPTKKEDKKVKFAKNLEQGPTPSPAAAKKDKKPEEKKTDKKGSGPRKVSGVTIDDKTIGTGPVAKSGQKVNMRYIGKLDNGKIFDQNTKGKPFSFTLGKGEVIRGWDIGIAGMQPGGERRIVIPADLAYGRKAIPGIPANSTLTFDVKLISIK